MQFYVGMPKQALPPCVSVIGSFDGLHLGHQALIQQAIATAKAEGLESQLISFEPLPWQYFTGQSGIRLSSLREKAYWLQQWGLDRWICLRFDAHFAAMPATDFISDFLSQALHVRKLWVGQDFRFGHRRLGDITLLERLGPSYGIQTFLEPDIATERGHRISSTDIRLAWSQGRMEDVTYMLGRPLMWMGPVIHGEKKASGLLNCPTANISMRHLHGALIRGVYAGWATLPSGERCKAVMNLGRRPSFAGIYDRLEVHLLDQNIDLYGQNLRVELCSFLRGEHCFESLVELKAQIAKDIARARTYLNS